MLKRFIIYGLFGWGIEIVWTGIGSLLGGNLQLFGYTNLWMFFIYGMGIFLEFIHDTIRGWIWPLRGLLWVLIIWTIEYSSGLLLLHILGVYPWRYYGPFAVNGLIRLDYAPAWFVAGLLFERMHKLLDAYGIA